MRVGGHFLEKSQQCRKAEPWPLRTSTVESFRYRSVFSRTMLCDFAGFRSSSEFQKTTKSGWAICLMY